MPLDPYFMSEARKKEEQASESDAMQMGRDDRRGGIPSMTCPFPKDSLGEAEWREGWKRERDKR